MSNICCTCICAKVATLAASITCNCSATDIMLAASAVNGISVDRVNCCNLTTLLVSGLASDVPNGQMIWLCDALIPIVSVNCSWVGVDGRSMNTVAERSLWSWGWTALGNNSTTTRSSPVREISSSTTWCQMSAGNCTTSAIKNDGTLWTWGESNGSGQLGDNTTIARTSPVREVSSSTNWCLTSVGTGFTAGLKTDGSLWAWGYNFEGALGDGTKSCKSSPVREISSGTTWCGVSLGRNLAIGIKTDGTVWTWGRNSYGQLGDNTTEGRSSPGQEITSGTSWCRIAAGYNHSMGIKTDGSLWAWGRNVAGRLGNNSTTDRCSPVQEISSSTSWCQAAGGRQFSAAIKTDGSLWTWGFNTCGPLGDNTTIDRSSPVREITSSNIWCQVTADFAISAAVRTDGSLWAWGNNTCGRLGDNTTIMRSSPVREVSSSCAWCLVDAGTCHLAAIKFDNVLVR